MGGGFVDGVIFHPSEKDLRYARTDMGGAYRWDNAAHRWQPLLDWVSSKDVSLMGIESIAVDPSDPNRVYLACGTCTKAPHLWHDSPGAEAPGFYPRNLDGHL